MKLVKHLSFSAGTVVAALAWLGTADEARAVFTLTGTAAELVDRGINADFEAPALARGDGEATTTNNAGPGWTFNHISGISSNYGVQDPAIGFYGAPPLPAPFEQFQIGFINLNNPFTQSELVSSPIGLLRAGETYTLNVAVGTRLTTAQNQTAFRVGLRASDGTDLGTFATALIVPSGTGGIINNLQYTLDMNTVPSYVGDDVRVVIGGYNTSLNAAGTYAVQLSQPNFDNVRLAGTFDDLPVTPLVGASLTINRQSGEISLSNTGASNLNIQGYSFTSVAGSFDQAEWTSIADNYDDTPGNGSVDSDDEWTELSASGSATNLSESELSGGDGGTLSTSSPVDLGDAWLRTPFQDVQGNLLLGDGTILPVSVQYGGLAIPSGDLNGDADITQADWTLFKAGQGTNFTGLSTAQAYLKGDLTGDKAHDLFDFFAFRTAYDIANGSGSFNAMVAGVPEPGAGLLLLVGSLLTVTGLSYRNLRRGASSMNYSRRILMIAAFVAVIATALSAERAAAQTTVAHWTFDTADVTVGANGITAAQDTTMVHNATTLYGGTGGTGGGTPQINSVSGRFGAGAEFTNANVNAQAQTNYAWMSFPQVTEIAGPTASDFAFSMWGKVPAQNPTWDSNTIIADWGNAGTGTHRFTYWFSLANVDSNVELRPRAQIRAANAPPDPATIDIIAATLNAAQAGATTFDEDAWHHYVFSWNEAAGQMSYYIDGVLRHTQTTAQPAGPNRDLLVSDSAVGALGAKRDNNRYFRGTMDEVYVFTGALNQEQVTNLFLDNTPPDGAPVRITLRADPATGLVELQNNSGEDIAFNAYRISSATGSLNHAAWDAISTGTPVSGFPQGNGSGNGWEAPGSGNNPADYNGDGIVDAADYVFWRKNNINGQAGLNLWKANFGATGGGLGGDDNELVEWYLTGDSTLADGGTISLGQAFDIGGTQNLAFTYTTSQGVRTGVIEYGAIGSGSGAAVPEPASGWLMLVAGCGLVVCMWRRRFQPRPALARVTACLVVTSVTASSAMATVTNDRIYRFGENGVPPQTQEDATAGQPVGSGAGNPAPGNTLDHIGPTGSFQVMLASSCPVGTCPASNSALPVYQDLTGLGRTGLGILFDGTDDYLNGFALGLPPITRSTARHISVYGSGSGTLNYDGVYQRGFQLWTYPHSGATAEQHVVSDTTEHGVRISGGGTQTWILRHGGTNVNSNVPVTFNQWSHVMAAMPVSSQPHRAVLYVNGVALTAHQENYDTSMLVNAQALIVGANTDASGTLIGTTNHFRGVLDELEMFIWGRGYDYLTGTYTNFGTFNYATDNAYAASFLTGEPGDIDNDGSFTQGDIDDFVTGWLNEKRVNNIRVGDLTTHAAGDLNFDGITDLTDARLLIDVLPGSGGGAGLDLSGFAALTGLAIPEPSTLGLGGLAFAWLLTRRRQRKG